MKKLILILSAILSITLINVVFANQAKSKLRGFAPTEWTSKDAKNPVTVQYGSGYGYYYSIQIYVSSLSNLNGPAPAGVNVKNCGMVTHINPGSTAICTISMTNTVVSFSSDNDEVPAYGMMQITES